MWRNVFKKLKSIQFRFIIIYLLVIIIGMQIIGIYFNNQLNERNQEQFKITVQNQERLLATLVREEMLKDRNVSTQQNNVNQILNNFSTNGTNILSINIIGVDRLVIASKNNTIDYNTGTLNLTNDDNIKQVLATGENIDKVTLDHQTNKSIYTRMSAIKDDKGKILGVIYITANIQEVYDNIDAINNIFIIGTFIAIIATTIIGFFLARTITQPIKEIQTQAKAMVSGDFSKRVIVKDADDELGQLSTTFNLLSERVQEAQSNIEEERRKLAAIITTMGDGIIACDTEGRISLINASARELLNLGERPVIGTSALLLVGQAANKKIDDIISQDEPIILQQEHDDLILRVEFSSILDDNDLVTGYIVVLYDITEQEKIDLERREFVSSVSHELRTPLTTMRGYIEALVGGAWQQPDIAPKFLEITYTETERMIRLVEELLQLSKMDRNMEHFEKEFVDINQLIHRVIDRFEMSTDNDKIFHRHILKEPVFVEGDPDKLIQVFDNILTNAIKYSPNGKHITIRTRTNFQHDRVSISVKDEGIGIPKANLEKIFTRFYRVDKARTRSMGGTGLGLAISKDIVDAHKGRIWAQSRENFGTTFFVMLPCEKNIIDEEEWL